jgi:hypothetical protein
MNKNNSKKIKDTEATETERKMKENRKGTKSTTSLSVSVLLTWLLQFFSKILHSLLRCYSTWSVKEKTAVFLSLSLAFDLALLGASVVRSSYTHICDKLHILPVNEKGRGRERERKRGMEEKRGREREKRKEKKRMKRKQREGINKTKVKTDRYQAKHNTTQARHTRTENSEVLSSLDSPLSFYVYSLPVLTLVLPLLFSAVIV